MALATALIAVGGVLAQPLAIALQSPPDDGPAGQATTAAPMLFTTSSKATAPGAPLPQDISARLPTHARAARNADPIDWEDNSISLILVNYPGNPSTSATGRALSRIIEGTVSPFWETQIGPDYALKVGRVGSISITKDPCGESPQNWGGAAPNASLWSEARAQLPNEYFNSRHVIYVWQNKSNTCGDWEGMAYLNPSPDWPGVMWVNGVTGNHARTSAVLAHEFGHVYSFGHASTLTCVSNSGYGKPDLPWENCFATPYGNLTDVMSNSFRLGSLSAAALVSSGLGEHLQPRTAGARERSYRLLPLSGNAGTRALVIERPGVRYVAEYRDGTGYDKALRDRTEPGGPGVYVIATITDASVLPTGDSSGNPWSTQDTFLLDGDDNTDDMEGRGYSWHLPLHTPMRLRDGAHITVTRVTKRGAALHYSPAGTTPPRGPVPTVPNNFRATASGKQAAVSWTGDGSAANFVLQGRRGTGKWRPLEFTPEKPGQTYVRANVVLSRPKPTEFRVRAVNSAGVSPYSYAKVTNKPSVDSTVVTFMPSGR